MYVKQNNVDSNEIFHFFHSFSRKWTIVKYFTAIKILLRFIASESIELVLAEWKNIDQKAERLSVLYTKKYPEMKSTLKTNSDKTNRIYFSKNVNETDYWEGISTLALIEPKQNSEKRVNNLLSRTGKLK